MPVRHVENRGLLLGQKQAVEADERQRRLVERRARRRGRLVLVGLMVVLLILGQIVLSYLTWRWRLREQPFFDFGFIGFLVIFGIAWLIRRWLARHWLARWLA